MILTSFLVEGGRGKYHITTGIPSLRSEYDTWIIPYPIVDSSSRLCQAEENMKRGQAKPCFLGHDTCTTYCVQDMDPANDRKSDNRWAGFMHNTIDE